MSIYHHKNIVMFRLKMSHFFTLSSLYKYEDKYFPIRFFSFFFIFLSSRESLQKISVNEITLSSFHLILSVFFLLFFFQSSTAISSYKTTQFQISFSSVFLVMLSHIKDLFRQRKERQQKRFFSNNRKQEATSEPMKVKTTYPVKTAIADTIPVKKMVIQPKRVVEVPLKKAQSSDNMTIVEADETKSNVAAEELANLLVKQDNKRRSQLPSYPGLERFELIRKLGE